MGVETPLLKSMNFFNQSTDLSQLIQTFRNKNVIGSSFDAIAFNQFIQHYQRLTEQSFLHMSITQIWCVS